jgi:pSer/pThr/pTyr-binding forkhead associated (FHA) protein
MLRLKMRRGPTPGAEYVLKHDVITIGRGSKNHIVIHDNEVSREHCRLIRRADDYDIEDLNSSNGTFLNGVRISGIWPVTPNSLIELGDTITLEYERLPRGLFASDEEDEADDDTQEVDAASLRYYLLMMRGPSTGHLYPLNDVIVTLGRDLSNDIVIQDPEVSRYHLRLRHTRDSFTVEDLGSTNGTLLNGTPVTEPTPLEPDDILKLGTMVQIRFVQQRDTAELKLDEEAFAKTRQRLDVDFSRDETLQIRFNDGRYQLNMSRLGTGLEPEALRDHIFVAYARQDWETFVAGLILNMQDAGQLVWADQYLAQGSEAWHTAVDQALAECQLMVLVVSPAAQADPYVETAYRRFLELSKPIIAVLYGVEALPEALKGLRTIQYDSAHPRKSFHRLIFEILQHRRS